jgi:hypothetical protein
LQQAPPGLAGALHLAAGERAIVITVDVGSPAQAGVAALTVSGPSVSDHARVGQFKPS